MHGRDQYPVSSFLGSLIFLVTTFPSCKSKPAVPEQKQNPSVIVDVMLATLQKVDNIVEANGTVDANENVELHPEGSGRLTYLNIPEGKFVLRYPSVAASAGYNFNRNRTSAGNVLLNQNRGAFAGVTLGIPIYNGSIYKRQQKVAEIDVQNGILQKDILLRNYTAQAVQSFQAYISSLQQLDSQKVNVALAQKIN